MIYKVWIVVEEIDEDKDHYHDIDPGFGPEAEFDNEKEAIEYANARHNPE